MRAWLRCRYRDRDRAIRRECRRAEGRPGLAQFRGAVWISISATATAFWGLAGFLAGLARCRPAFRIVRAVPRTATRASRKLARDKSRASKQWHASGAMR